MSVSNMTTRINYTLPSHTDKIDSIVNYFNRFSTRFFCSFINATPLKKTTSVLLMISRPMQARGNFDQARICFFISYDVLRIPFLADASILCTALGGDQNSDPSPLLIDFLLTNIKLIFCTF